MPPLRALQRFRPNNGLEVPLLSEALPASEFYPVSIDIEKRLLSFAHISRETYRNAAFLVPKQIDMGRDLFTFNLDDLLLPNAELPAAPARTHYILISAFCCSTLLARYLDHVADCLVLREPGLVGQLAMLRHRPLVDYPVEWEQDWLKFARLGLRLMSRGFSASETVVVKASDVGNTMGDVILNQDQRSRIILLSVGLRTFILSVLKSPSRRDWTRSRAQYWHNSLQIFPQLVDVPLKELDDAQKSAYIWIVTQFLWKRLRSQSPAERLLLLDGEQISSLPHNTLSQVTEFFGLPCSRTELNAIIEGSVSSSHSKRPNETYDSAKRGSDLNEWEQRYGQITDQAIAWAVHLANRLQLGSINGAFAEMG